MKLTARDRHTLLAALAPPPGFTTAAALGTSYGVDALAVVAAVVSLAGQAWPDEDNDDSDGDETGHIGAISDTALSLAATAMRNKLRILFHSGHLDGGTGPARARLSQFDGFLLAQRTAGSAFHPKVWLVKFDGPGGALYRFVCTSRNLTSARNWELGAVFEGRALRGPTELGKQIALAVNQLELRVMPRAIRRMVDEARNVDFRLGTATRRVEVAWQSSSRASPSLAERLPPQTKRVLIMAPFIEEKFVRKLAKACRGRITLLSTHDALRKAQPWLAEMSRVERPVHARVVRDVVGSQNIPLHAKLVLCETDRETLGFLGSANATGAAWGLGGKNTEAVVVLHDVLQIQPFLDEFCGTKAKPTGWVTEFADGGEADESEDKDEERALRDEVARLSLLAKYDAAREVLSVALKVGIADVALFVVDASGTYGPLAAGKPVALPGIKLESLSRIVRVKAIRRGTEVSVDLLADLEDGDALDEKRAQRRAQGLDPAEQSALFFALLDGRRAPLKQTRLEDDVGPRAVPEQQKRRAADRRRGRTFSLEQVIRACAEAPDRVEAALRAFEHLPADVAAIGVLLRAALAGARKVKRDV